MAQTVIGLMEVAYPRELRGDVSCIVGRTVIDEDHFIVGIVKFTHGIEAGGESSATVV